MALPIAPTSYLMGVDWFFTTDTGILKKAKSVASVRVANPIEFVGGV